MSKGRRVKEARRQQEMKRAEEMASAKKAGGWGKNLPWMKIFFITILIVLLAVLGTLTYRHLNKGQFDSNSYAYLSYDKFVKLGDYKNLEYSIEKVSVSDKEVKDEIDSRISAKTTTDKIYDGAVKKGDTVNIDYVGKMNGKTFTGGTATGTNLKIGSKTMIDGFESGLIGKKIGDKVKLNLKFPKNYSNDKSLSGKKVVFEVTLNYKSVTTTPKYDENFVKENSDYDSKKDYEASIKKQLLSAKKRSAEESAGQELIEKAVEKAKMKKYPKGKVSAEIDALESQYESMASQYGMSYEDYLAAVGSSKKEMRKQLKDNAKEEVKKNLTVHAIAKKEGIKVKKSDFEEYMKELLKEANMTEEEFKNNYGQSIKDYVSSTSMQNYYMEKLVGDKLMELGKQKK